MSKSDDTNKKLPDPNYVAGRSNPQYPYVFRDQDANGRAYTKHANPNKPNESFETTVDHSGAYKTTEISNSYNGLTTSLAHEERSYVAGGKSVHSDGHTETSTEGTHHTVSKGDIGVQSGGVSYKGSQKEIGGTQEGGYHHTEGHTYNSSNGDVISDHSGNFHASFDKDKVEHISGNKYTIVEGDEGVHIQGGNMDIRVEAGKLQIYSGAALNISSTSAITVSSTTQLTMQVGSSSIVITPTAITITSTTGDVSLLSASGNIITAGASTKIQGGGGSLPPKTFA